MDSIMADPMIQVLEASKKAVTDGLKEALSSQDMKLVGSKYNLGLASFKAGSEVMLYAHIVEINKQKSRISLAPGIPYLGDCEQSVIPKNTFDELLKDVKCKMNIS